MALFNFQERFVEFIRNGSKTHTIRSIRKYPQKVGELMHLYCGLRTKHTQRIIEAPACKAVKTIFILPDQSVFIVDEIMTAPEAQHPLDNELERLIFNEKSLCLNILQKNELAWNDGFRPDNAKSNEGSFELMIRWWSATHQLPFAGHINYWK